MNDEALIEQQEARVREFIQAHPLAILFGAFVLGFAIARTMRIDA